MEVGESTLATRFYDVTDDLPKILLRVSSRLGSLTHQEQIRADRLCVSSVYGFARFLNKPGECLWKHRFAILWFDREQQLLNVASVIVVRVKSRRLDRAKGGFWQADETVRWFYLRIIGDKREQIVSRLAAFTISYGFFLLDFPTRT